MRDRDLAAILEKAVSQKGVNVRSIRDVMILSESNTHVAYGNVGLNKL